MIIMNKRFTVGLSLLVGILALVALPCFSSEITVNLEPAEIHISAFYNGSFVKVSGTIPAGTEAVVRAIGQKEEVHVKKKGKVAGLLWMNTADITFKNTPGVFILLTSKDLENMVTRPDSKIGFSSIKDKVEIEPASEDKDFLFGEFVKLKQTQRLYLTNFDAIKYGQERNGVRPFSALLPVPPKMKPGTYDIDVLAVQNGSVIAKADTKLVVRAIGFPEELTKLAFDYPLLYGIMAVFIAIFAGLLIGVLFKGKGGAH